MIWTRQRDARGKSERRSRILAGFAMLLAAGFFYLNFDPMPVGADPSHKRPEVTSLAAAALGGVLQPVGRIAESSVGASAMTGPGAAPEPIPSFTTADRVALVMNLALLEQGRRRLMEVNDYRCVFYKQERLGSELSDGQSLELKMRHKPLSIYMKWLSGEKGRELLYVEGEHDGKMIVHPGGWKARILPSIKLDPDGMLALRECRHPVTMVGLLKLCEEVIARRKTEIEQGHHVQCRLIEQEMLNDRPCYCFVSNYLDRKVSEEYRKSIQYVDKEWLLPVCVKNYGWPEPKQTFADANALDEGTLIEHYVYSELHFNQQLVGGDFSCTNQDYNFRR